MAAAPTRKPRVVWISFSTPSLSASTAMTHAVACSALTMTSAGGSQHGWPAKQGADPIRLGANGQEHHREGHQAPQGTERSQRGQHGAGHTGEHRQPPDVLGRSQEQADE